MNAGRQNGITTVEFAIVASVLLLVIIGIIDISRLYFSVAALNESTRRGVRMAAVCPIDDPAIARVAAFGTGGSSTLVAGLQPAHFDVQYLGESGAPVVDPGGAGFEAIHYVRVRLNGGFQLRTVIPGISEWIAVPDFATTLPRESLGVPREGAITPC